jgi:hypothetical protein
MKNAALTYLIILASFSLSAQNRDSWTSFWNKDSTLKGFKDKNGTVKIEPKFMGFTSANQFDDIIAVTEEANEHWTNYYLTKGGRIIGKDSVHIFDNGFDCESEGFIRFRDRKTDKVGMFNRHGDIVVPAEYNELTRVRNGMIIALKGAKKEQWDEHYSWKGGKEILIDTNSKILIDHFKYKNALNFYSVLLSAQPSANVLRQNFKGVNGQYYSFIDFDKEFRNWLQTSLLNHFTKTNLLNCTHKEISFWKEPSGWTREAKTSFINRNFELIKTELLKINSKNCDYQIFDETLNPYIYDSNEFKDYFNNCGESKDWQYPVKNIVISYNNKKDLLQNHFEFLRTKNGYRLIGITINTRALK